MTQDKDRNKHIVEHLRKLADQIEGEQAEVLQFQRNAHFIETEEHPTAQTLECSGLMRLQLMTKHPSP